MANLMGRGISKAKTFKGKHKAARSGGRFKTKQILDFFCSSNRVCNISVTSATF